MINIPKDNITQETIPKMTKLNMTELLDQFKTVVGSVDYSPVSKPYYYNDIQSTINEKYFDNLRSSKILDKTTGKVTQSNLNIDTLAIDILKHCSVEEVDELIARLTSDSEYLSRKGYNSINLKGD